MNARTNKMVFDVSYAAFFKALLIILGVWLIYMVRDLLLIFVIAVVISSAINPLVAYLQKKKIPRALSVLVLSGLILGLFALIFSLLIPPVVEQITQLVTDLPEYIAYLSDRYEWIGALLSPGLIDIEDVVKSLGQSIGGTIEGIYGALANVFGGLFAVVLIFVFSIYLSLQEDALKKTVRFLVPRKYREYADNLVDKVQTQMGRWLRGQLLLALSIGVITYLAMELLGVRFALLLGLLAGLLEIVPYLGPIIAATPAVLLVLPDSWVMALVVIGVYILIQQLENHLLVPKIMGKITGLNPVIVLIAVLVGAELGGILGVILAVPLATALSISLHDVFGRDKDELVRQDGPGGERGLEGKVTKGEKAAS